MVNTKDILIAQKYSDALVQITKDGEFAGRLTYQKISTDLNLVKEILTQSKDLDEFLTNPITSVEDKKEIIDKVFSTEIDGLIINFLKILMDKRRFELFNDILVSYNKSLDDVNNISRIEVTSAVEMTEEAKNKLKEKLEEKLKKNVVFELNINPNIIAGLVIKMGDNVIDMSLKNKLEDLSKNITK